MKAIKKTKEKKSKEDIILRMYQYRLYPSRKQQIRLINQFKICKNIYNYLLELSSKLLITHKFDFDSLVKDIKTTCPDYYYQAYAQVLQNVSDRLGKAFKNFFDRVKKKKQGIIIKAGFPRFKSRIQSITYPQMRVKGKNSGFYIKADKRVYVPKIGNIPIILHREPKGKIKTMTIKQNYAGQWFATFSCELPAIKSKHKLEAKNVGIDVGTTNLATLSDGISIPNPRFFVNGQKKLRKLQRRLSRKKKGSKNRNKQRIKVARWHLKIANRRDDFLHKLSRILVSKYKIIGIEKLQIQNMLKNHCLAKHISDVGWGKLFQFLQYKAVTSDGEVRKNKKTRGSSCRCSRCGNYEFMPLSKKIFICSKCGFTTHRDINASDNHLKDTAGIVEITTPMEILPLLSRSEKASKIIEVGTIYGRVAQC